MSTNDRNMIERKDGKATETRGPDRLVHLDQVKDRYRIADGMPDIRGWDVKSRDGRDVGEVKGLMVDTGRGAVRYLEVELADDVVGEGEGNWMLVPIGRARLDDENDTVHLRSGIDELRGSGADRTKFSSDDERSIHSRFAGAGTDRDGSNDDQLYGGQDFDERHFLGERGSRQSARGDQGYLIPVAVVEEVVVTREPMRGDSTASGTKESGAQRSTRSNEQSGDTASSR